MHTHFLGGTRSTLSLSRIFSEAVVPSEGGAGHHFQGSSEIIPGTNLVIEGLPEGFSQLVARRRVASGSHRVCIYARRKDFSTLPRCWQRALSHDVVMSFRNRATLSKITHRDTLTYSGTLGLEIHDGSTVWSCRGFLKSHWSST